MARARNDGKGRMGGRAKGTPNKVTASLRDWIANVIDASRDQMINDIKELEPKERLLFLERLMSYVIPKQQSVKADIETKKDLGMSLEERLRIMAEG